jgi:hypothetical protein
MVGPRPRPVIPRPTRRRRPSLRLTSVLGALALAGVILAGGLLWARPTAPAHEAAKQIKPRQQVETARLGPSRATSSRAPDPAEVWASRLARLDALRTRAFAQRKPELLRQMYVPGPLLTADAALLTRIVPPGCGLTGVRTTYSALRVAPRGPGAVITATARLTPSRLLCAGRSHGTAAGAGPARLRVELVRTAAGLRIAAQQAA